jgi:hypothetical protein
LDIFVKVYIDRPGVIIFFLVQIRGYDKSVHKFMHRGSMHGVATVVDAGRQRAAAGGFFEP